jgi:hypothetical protein
MKIKKIEPQQLVDKNIGYKDYRKILKPALKRMLGEHYDDQTKTDFIVKTNFEYSDLKDKKMGLIILGDHTSGWIKTVKDQVKEDKKNSCYGSCYAKKKADGSYAIVLFPEKGSPKKNLMIKQLEKFALKGTPFTIELAPGGELEEDNAADVVIEDIALPDDSNEPEEADTDGPTGELLEIPEKVKLAAEHLRRGNLEADPDKKTQVINFLEKSVDSFYNKYLDLHPDDQNLNKTIEAEYKAVRKILNDDKYRKPVMNVADLKTLAGGSSWGFKKTNYDKILDLLEQYQKAGDQKVKHAKLQEINILIDEWQKSHPLDKRSKDDVKRFHGLMQLRTNIAPFIGTVKEAAIRDIDTNTLNDETTIFKEKAGTAIASERAKQIAEATVDDRAIELARLLKLGKASDDDANFGAVMKWLTDTKESNLSAKYTAAAKKIFGVDGVLLSDITKVFGIETLRSKYLIELLSGKASPYAPTALAFGLLGKAWFSSESNDAFEFIEKNLNAAQIAVLLKPETQNLQNSFEGAIAKKLLSNEKFKAQLNSIQLLKQSSPQNKTAIQTELDKVKSTKYPYVSAADYFLCTTFLRIDDADKFATELKKWVAKSSDEERKEIQGNSAFYKLLDEKISLIPGRGISKSTASYLKSIISTYKVPATGQESGKVIEQLEQIAARQNEKNALSRWKQDKSVGDQFKKILFSEDVESPQEALINKFCTPEDIKKWESADSDGKKLILEKAVAELEKIMAKADIHADKVDEILETVYSDGARGEVYNQLKDIVKSKTKIGASGSLMKALDTLAPDSKEIVGIKNDIELLKALKAKALQGTFKTEEDRERWRTAMRKLGLPPSDADILAAETLMKQCIVKLTGVNDTAEDKKAAGDASERYRLLSDLKDIANENLTVNDAIVDKVKSEFKRPPGLPRRNKILTKDQIEEQKKKEKDLKKTAGYWASKLASEHKKGFTGRDDHRLVQLAYESKQQGVSGADIMEELLLLSPNLHETIKTPSSFDFGDSASILKAILEEGRNLNLTEMLNHARKDAIFQRRVRVEDLKVMTENIDDSKLVAEWFDTDALKTNIANKKKLVDEAEELKKTSPLSPDQKKRLRQLDREMLNANNALMRFDIKADVLKSLDDTVKADKVLEFKKYLREKICSAIQDENKSKELQKSLKDAGIEISDSDLAIIAASLKVTSNLEYEASLETGLQWSSLSSRMLQRDLATAQQLREGWKGREKLQQITKLSKNQLLAEEQVFVDRMKQVDEELVLAQEKFVESKNKYDDRLKTFISIVVNSLIATAAILSGVGSAAVLIQLAWAIGTTALSTAINQGIEKLVKGNNYGGVEEFVVQLVANEVGTVLTFAAAQVLDKIPLGDILDKYEKGITNGNKIAEMFTGPLKDTLKDIPEDILKKYTENVVKSFHEKGSIIGNTLEDLKDYGKELITDLPFNYIKGILSNTAELGLSEASKKIFGTSGEDYFSYDDEWGENVDPNGNKLPNKLDMITDRSLLDNFVENFKNPKVMINFANSFIRGEDGFDVNFIEAIIEGPVDKTIETILGNFEEEEADKIDTDALKEQIKKNLAEADAKFRAEIIANLGSLPIAEKVEAAVIQTMSPTQLKKLYNRFIKVHQESDILNFIKSRFKITSNIWEAFKKSVNIKEEKSLDAFLKDFSESNRYLKFEKFANDIISGQISKEYTIPTDTHFNSPEHRETIPSGISIKDKFDKWKLIMEASRFAIL